MVPLMPMMNTTSVTCLCMRREMLCVRAAYFHSFSCFNISSSAPRRLQHQVASPTPGQRPVVRASRRPTRALTLATRQGLEYEVEQILAKRGRGRALQYL
eukprot:487500-Hanusia_phi.AAC.1